MIEVLVTGGAGYIGTTLVPMLLNKGYRVTIFDNLLYNGDVLIPFFRTPNFSFIKGDIRDRDRVREVCKGKDFIIHLAAIVGYGACRKDEKLAYEVNIQGTQNVIDAVSSEQVIIYASTGSNYGILNELCTEHSPLNPLSVYGKTKTEAEKIISRSNRNYISFRFATAFGVSPRLRLDLLINELSYMAFKQKYLVVYESHFMRTFIHVHDISRSFLFAIENKGRMIRNVYNVGSNSMNLSKRDVCKIISNHTNVYIHYADYDGDADKRNYIVSYNKINSIGFDTDVSVDDGIKELLKAHEVISISNVYVNS